MGISIKNSIKKLSENIDDKLDDITAGIKNKTSGNNEEKNKGTTGVATFGAVKNGKLVFDASAQMYGFANEDERQKYIKENPELYTSMGGYKYVPSGTPLINTESITKSNEAIQRIVERFKNTDGKKVQEAINAVGSGQWLDADTMKKHTDIVNMYVNDFVTLEKLGYFDSLPENERKGYVDALKGAKNLANNNKKVFADYKDSDSYKEAVNNYVEYGKVKNGNLEELEAELQDWEKEWNAWNEGTNSTLGDKEWIMQEWRFNNDGQRTIPYEATSYPEIFMGKTITEAKEIIDKRREYLRLAKKDAQINDLANEAQTNVDFEKISSYEVCNTEKELLEKYDTKDFDSNNIDLLVDYLCTDSKAVRDSITNHKYTSYLEIYGVRAAESVNMLSFDWAQKGYDQLTNEEKKVVKYFAKNDTKKLYEYLRLNEEIWKNRGAKQIAESIDGNILAKASYAIAGSGDRIKQSMVGALNYITGKEDYVEPTKTQLTSQYIRQNLDGFGGFLYDATGAITYMTPSILMNAILPGSGFAVTGITAAGGAYNDGIKMGMTKSQARTYGTLIGVSETVLSKMFSGVVGLNGNITKIGVEKITSGINNGILRFIATIGVNAVSEGFEEFAQEVLEPLFENIALGYNKNDWDDIDWDAAVYNGLLGAFLGSTSNVVTRVNDVFNSNNSMQKLNPNEVISGIWEDSPKRDKNIVEKSRLESVENYDESGIIEKNSSSVPGVYTTTISWSIFKKLLARPEGAGYFTKKIKQHNPRVEAYELKINPNNEGYHLKHPDGRYVQFENMVDNVLQDGKCVLNKKRSFYHVYDYGYIAQKRVLDQANRQIETANAVGYKVEWLVSDEKAVEQISRLFKENNINISVKFYPE